MRKILDFCNKHSVEILVICLCIPFLAELRNVNCYHTVFYFTDYSTGFGGKKLLGQICSLWLPEVVRKRHLLPLIVSVNLLMVGLFTWFCSTVIKNSQNNKLAYMLVLAVYLLSPYSFVGIISSAEVDFYLATTSLGFLYLFIKHRGTWYYYALTFLLMCVACLIHNIFCNIYFPLFLALFIYDIFFEKEKRKTKIIIYSLFTLSLFLLFCTIAFYSTMNIDFHTYYDYLQTRVTSSISIVEPAVYYEMYAKLPEHFTAYIQPMWKYNIARFVLTLIVFSPLFLLFWLPWLMTIKNAKTKEERWCYILMQLALNLIILPAYIMAVDYQRWTYAYLFCQFSASAMMIYLGDKTFIEQCNKLILIARQNYIITLLLAVYICSTPLVTTADAPPIIDNICSLCGVHWHTNEVLP